MKKLEPALDNLIASIKSQPNGAFRNKTSQDAMINKVQAIKKQVAAKDYDDALSKLQDDLMQKTDGFVVRGKLDANDWVTDPASQKQVYSAIQSIQTLLVVVKTN